MGIDNPIEFIRLLPVQVCLGGENTYFAMAVISSGPLRSVLRALIVDGEQ